MPTTRLPRGLMGELVLADQADFATPVADGFSKTLFYSEGFAQQEGLPDDDMIGGTRANNRDARAPAPDLAALSGALEVPLDLAHLGWWLKGAFGAPVTTAVAATGSIVFSGQPGAGSTITINSVVFTFTAGAPGAGEIEIGAALADTVDNIADALNASVDASVAVATYGASGGNTVTVTHDTGGPTGNAFTLAATVGSNGTPSGATLAGGHYSHVFTSGAEVLPSRTLGIRRRVPAAGDPIWFRVTGAIVSTIRFRVAREAGFRRVALDLVGRDEAKAAPADFGVPASALTPEPVAAAKGVLKIDGTAVATLVSADATYDNGLVPLEFARGDKYVGGYAPDNPAKWTGSAVARYADESLYDWSVARTAKAMTMEWVVSATRSLILSAPAVRIERHGVPIGGPAGIQATIPFRGEQTDAAAMLTATLKNSVAEYA